MDNKIFSKMDITQKEKKKENIKWKKKKTTLSVLFFINCGLTQIKFHGFQIQARKMQRISLRNE